MLDDNLLACSDEHIKSVFKMLRQQHYGKPEFTGGLEAARLKDWHVEEILKLNPATMYFAYDTPDDYEPLVEAGRKFEAAGFSNNAHKLFAYVLIGYPRDTIDKAEMRLIDTVMAGFLPMAMLYQGKERNKDTKWRRFQREWANKIIVGTKYKQIRTEAGL